MEITWDKLGQTDPAMFQGTRLSGQVSPIYGVRQTWVRSCRPLFFLSRLHVKNAEVEATFFNSNADFRRWLQKHHAAATELLVGFHHKDSERPGISYAAALDEALCFGWIDGVRKNVDATSYTIRFTPRRPGSIWSLVNVRHAERLIAQQRMAPPGAKAFDARDAKKTGVYSFEQKIHALDAAFEKKFRASKKAWAFWGALPPGYRRVAIHWVMSAKQQETRERRLGQLIDASARGVRQF